MHPNDAMKIVLRRLRAHGVSFDQPRGGPKWVSDCPAHDGRVTGPAITWHQRKDGTVKVGPHWQAGVIVCGGDKALAALDIKDDRIKPDTGHHPFVQPARSKPRRTGPTADSFEVFERLRQALRVGGYAGRRADKDRYECPACGAAGDGRGLRITHKPDAVGKRQILLLCHKNYCDVREILEPLGMTVADICAGDDVDDLDNVDDEDDHGGQDTDSHAETTTSGDGHRADGQTGDRQASGDVEFSDAHLAERVVSDVLADSYCWADGLGWLHWDGTRWERTPDREARERVRQWVVDNYAKASRDAADTLARDGKQAAEPLQRVAASWFRTCSKTKISAIADLASGIVSEDGATFDQHPDLLNCPNGVIDLRTGQIRPHDPALRFTKVTGVDYVPGAEHPDWTRALQALPAEVAEWLQVRSGQAATGYAPDDDVIPICQGSGKNGKSTIFTGIARALGEFHTLVSDRVVLANPDAHPTELMELRGTRFAVIEETPEERRFNIQRLKKITGTTQISARLIAQNSVTFDVTHSLFVTSNHRPVVTQTDYGTWRRLALVRFPYTFDGNAADPAYVTG